MTKKQELFFSGLSETETAEEIKQRTQVLYDELEKIKSAYQEHFDKLSELNNDYISKTKDKNPYAAALVEMHKEQEELTVDVGNYRDAHEQKLAIDKWYTQEYEKVLANRKGLSAEEQSNAFTSLNMLYDERSAQAEEDLWQQRGQKIGNIVGTGLTNILTEFNDFDGNMRKMSKKLYDFLLQQSMEVIWGKISELGWIQNVLKVLNLGSKKGSFVGAASNVIKGVGKAFGVFHSGGIVPVGANEELPGTKEQLALLKGGERILSPSENTNYNNQNGGSSPVVFNNFNVKAWDSKDVQKYLLENKTVLNQITYDAIKNNNNHLRHMVRNA